MNGYEFIVQMVDRHPFESLIVFLSVLWAGERVVSAILKSRRGPKTVIEPGRIVKRGD